MMSLPKIFLAGGAAAALTLTVAASAVADTRVVAGSGWQYDETAGFGSPVVGAPLTFNTRGARALALTDGDAPDDNYTLWVSYNGVPTFLFNTTPGTTATPFDDNTGPYAADFAPA